MNDLKVIVHVPEDVCENWHSVTRGIGLQLLRLIKRNKIDMNFPQLLKLSVTGLEISTGVTLVKFAICLSPNSIEMGLGICMAYLAVFLPKLYPSTDMGITLSLTMKGVSVL